MADDGTDGTPPEPVRQAIADAVVACDTVDPREPLTDLDAIGSRVTDATVVGLGEPSHGTREVFRLKHRLFRYLVEERGCRALAVEANFSDALALNEHVVDGEGTARERLLDSAVHDVYHCESVLALVEWIRAYNEAHPTDPVRVYGFDMQQHGTTAEDLRSYLERVDPDLLGEVGDDLDAIEIPEFDERDAERLHEYAAVCDRVGSTLAERFDESRAAYVERTSERAFDRARHQVRLLRQAARQFGAIREDEPSVDHLRIRDEAMAENVARLLEFEGDGPVALWAHNGHVKRGAVAAGLYGDVPSMGENLAARDDVEYVPLGISVGTGSVRSYSPAAERYETYPVPEPPAGSLPDALAETGVDVGYLDLAEFSAEGPVAEWFAGGPKRHSITGAARDGDPVEYVESNPQADFDGLAFVRESTAATGLSTD
jgi:erythromycin esterase